MPEAVPYFERFFDLSPDLLCIAGYDGYFRKVNPSVSRLLGYSDEELYSRPIDEFVHPDDRVGTSAGRKQMIRSSNTLFHFENRYLTKGGDTVWLAWTSHPVEDEGLVFAIAKDVTQKKKLEAERLALLEDLTAVNNELKRFTLTTSHDLRSPLATIIMAFDLLDVSKIADRDTVDLVEILKSTGTQLEKTLNNYVDALSEAVLGQSRIEEIDLTESLPDVLQSIDPLIKSSNTTVHSDFSEFSKVIFNRTFMDSVFLNLITNSIRYSRPNVPPVISVQADKTAGTKRLIVTDNGRGIDMEKAEGRIFGINQTFHDHDDSKGVGLYLVHSHVTSLGGEISVESQVDVGTRFTISFKE